MHSERRILRNTVLLGGSEALGQLANLLFVAALARAFGSEMLGQYSLGMAVGAVASLFVGLGTQSFLIRDLSRNAPLMADRLGVLIPVQCILAVVAWLAATTVGTLLSSGIAAVGIIMSVCAYQILWRSSGLLYVPFRAAESMHVPAAAELGHRLFILAFGLAMLLLGATPGATLIVLPLSALGLAAFGWWRMSLRFGRPALRFAPAEAFVLFRSASPFFDVLLLGMLYTRGGIVMLGALRDEVEVGLYAATDRTLIAPLLLPNMLNAAVYPALSRLQHTAPDQAARLARRSMVLMLAGSVPLAALLYAFAPQLIRLLFGDEYLVAVPALQLLAWTVPIRGIALLLGSQLAAMNRQKEMALARLIGLVSFGVLSYLLIAHQGFTGLAVAVLSCEILQAILYAALIRSRSRVNP